VAFPTTGILDDFNRGNEGPPPSASWSTLDNGLEVDTNQLKGVTNGTNTSYWNVETFGADCECYYTIANAADEHGVLIRLKDVVGEDTLDGYLIWQADVDEITIARLDNNVPTALGAAISQAVVSGDKLGVECVGDQISAYFDDGGAGWGSIGVRTEATYGAVGYIGAYLEDVDGRSDDFGGGTVVVAGARRIFIT